MQTDGNGGHEGGEEERKKRGRAKLTEEQREASDRRKKVMTSTLKALQNAARGKDFRVPFPIRAPIGTHVARRDPICPYFQAQHDESGGLYRASMIALASVDGEHERAWRRGGAMDVMTAERQLVEADGAAVAVESRVDEFVERVEALLPALRRHCILPDDLSKQPPASLVASLLAFVHASREIAELANNFTAVVNRYWSDYLAPRDEAEEPGPLAGEPNLKVLWKLPAELRELLPTPAGATDLTRVGPARAIARQVAAFGPGDPFGGGGPYGPPGGGPYPYGAGPGAYASGFPLGAGPGQVSLFLPVPGGGYGYGQPAPTGSPGLGPAAAPPPLAAGETPRKKRGRPPLVREGPERKKTRPLAEHEQRAVVAYFQSAASDYAAEHPEDPRGCFRKDGEYSGFAPWIYEMIKELKAQHPELADVHPGTIKGVGCTQFKEYADAMLAQIKKAQAGRRKKGEEAEAEAAPAPAAEEEPAKKKKKKPAAPAAEDDD